MPTAPAGPLSLPLKYLRDQLAACSTFQTWVGALNATEALDSIFYVATSTLTLPLAVVDWGRSGRLDAEAGGTRTQFDQDGELTLLLRAGVTSSADDQQGEEGIVFMNTVGNVLAELLQLAGVAAYLDLVSVEHGPPQRPSEAEANSGGDFIQVLVTIEYRSHA